MMYVSMNWIRLKVNISRGIMKTWQWAFNSHKRIGIS